ncbi:tRNA dihydrouridine(16) synthase DusC [Paraferrimonas sp. SM1919]|uniref:tRNA dihydrouridine(16) synthase DusC n=1 Tax=Paraferrimonas sp. SM1919 TaxID=2662263 RepID=UPI001969F97A|nr:tRNA dihydrouridine(16) synthase DusC [Paraferrimonas sp. SM1919]
MLHLTLAPMEGVLDHLMRDLLTRSGQYDLCVTEFIRVIDQLLPERVFYKLCPELKNGSKTPSGTPVRVQLLGQHPSWMAENANAAIELGSDGIDINFGCPSKLVNGSNGGAALLKTPEVMYQVVKSVREAVPKDKIVSAKMRLGWDSAEHCLELADAIYQAGANEMAVHGRTKADGYKAGTVKWQQIANIVKHVNIPVTANGDIIDRDSALKCQQITGTHKLMLGRGALNLPNLGEVIRNTSEPMNWTQTVALMLRYSELEMEGDKGLYYPNRIKQWFSYLKSQYPQANELFREIRIYKKAPEIVQRLEAAFEALEN